MDICILTTDRLLGRALTLELRDAGFDAVCADTPLPARLCLCDLDSCGEKLPERALFFSYDASRRQSVAEAGDTQPAGFLQRPIDMQLLRDTVRKLLLPVGEPALPQALVFVRKSRRVRGEGGEVRLSVKEAALLSALCEKQALTRAEAQTLFGGGDSNVVDVYMHYLRKKLHSVHKQEVIRSMRGEGYALLPDAAITLR